MYQRLSIRDLLNLALGTPEPGAVNFNILHRTLLCILKEISIQNVATDYYKIDEEFYMIPSETEFHKVSEFEAPVVKIVSSTPAIFLKDNSITSDENKKRNITKSVSETSVEERKPKNTDSVSETFVEDYNYSQVKGDEESINTEDSSYKSSQGDDASSKLLQDEEYTTTQALPDDEEKINDNNKAPPNIEEIYHKYDRITDDILMKIEFLERNCEEKVKETNNKFDEKQEEISNKIIKVQEDLKELSKDIKENLLGIKSIKEDITHVTREIKELDSEKIGKEEMNRVNAKQAKMQKEIEVKVNVADFQSEITTIRNIIGNISDELSEFRQEILQSMADIKENVDLQFQNVKDSFADQDEENINMKDAIMKLADEFKASKISINNLRNMVLRLQHQKTAVSAGTTKCVSCGRPAIQSGGDCVRLGKLCHEDLKIRNKSISPDKDTTVCNSKLNEKLNKISKYISDDSNENTFKEKLKRIHIPSRFEALDESIYKNN